MPKVFKAPPNKHERVFLMNVLKKVFLIICASFALILSPFLKRSRINYQGGHYIFLDSFKSDMDAGIRTTREFYSLLSKSNDCCKIDINLNTIQIWRLLKQTKCYKNSIVVIRSPGFLIKFMALELLLWRKFKIAFYTGDIYHKRYISERMASGDNRKIKTKIIVYKLIEKVLWKYSDAVLSPCNDEAEYIRAFNDNSFVLPIRFFSESDFLQQQIRIEQKPPSNNLEFDFVFVGGVSHPPNRGAVINILTELAPVISQKYPNSRIYIIGKGWDTAALNAPSNVEFTGMISDQELEKYLERAQFLLCPLPYGAGVKGKVIESMFYGLTIVSNSVGWQGIDADFAEPLELTCDQVAFIDQIMNDKRELSKNATKYRNYLLTNYSERNAELLDKQLRRSLDQK